MATLTQEQKTKARLEQQIGEKIVNNRWFWRGTEFLSFEWCGIATHQAFVRFIATFRTIKVNIETKDIYNIPDQVCMFAGDDAMGDAVKWTADRLIEIDKILRERTEPYAEAHAKYKRALRGRR